MSAFPHIGGNPLPEIEGEQEAAVMRLWGDMNPSDRAVTDLLLTDGCSATSGDPLGYVSDRPGQLSARCR